MIGNYLWTTILFIFIPLNIFIDMRAMSAVLPNQDRIKDNVETIISTAHSSSLVNWTSFTTYNELLIPSRNLCSVENGKGKFLVLYLVHTKPSHLERREVIRSSWGQVKDSNGFNSRVVFVMGKEERVKQRKSMRNPKLALLPPKKYALMNEYENYEDILQGDFKENDPNSNILKTLMGWKWLTENCDSSNINNSAKNTSSILIVKTTDNVFIETFHLFDFVQAVLNKSPNNETLICDVVSHGSIARRPEGTSIVGGLKISEMARLNKVIMEKGADHPDFCNGISYMMSLQTVKTFLEAIQKPEVQLQHENYATEDVFLFGYIRKSIEIEPLYLNPRFTYDKFSITRWLKSTTNDQHPFPYIFAAMNTSTEDYLTLSKNLWEKTSSIHIY